MRYGLLSTAAVAALALSVAGGIAQTSGSGGGAAGGGSGAAASPSGGGMSSGGASGSGAAGSGMSSQSGGGAATSSGAARPSAGAAPSGSGAQQSTQSGTSGASGTTAGQAGTSAQPGSDRAGTAAQSGSRQGGASGTTTGSVPANITSEQRTQITRSFSSVRVAPVTNVNFALSVGTVIPTTVEWHDLPAEVVTVVPAYRGYKYVLVGNRIVIIEPASRKIVTVIERTAEKRRSIETEGRLAAPLFIAAAPALRRGAGAGRTGAARA
jgi:Protein of unknown function (DUF1236)